MGDNYKAGKSIENEDNGTDEKKDPFKYDAEGEAKGLVDSLGYDQLNSLLCLLGSSDDIEILEDLARKEAVKMMSVLSKL